AVPRIRVLDEQEEEMVHEYSVRSLNDIGVLIRSKSVLQMLEEAGAMVDYDKWIAKFPEDMVNDALKNAPKRFKLCAREPRNDLEIPVNSGIPHISTDGLTIYMKDLETGERKDALRADLANFAKVADALDAVKFFWPIVTVRDAPEEAHAVHEMWTSLNGCSMHVQGMCLNKKDALTEIELASLIVGGKEELKKRPIFSIIHCSIAPLSFEKGLTEAHVELARAGIPVVSMSMSLSGMSCPVTFAATVVNINTENLASLIITQSAEPGAPHIYCSESAPVDMVTGNMNYTAPEMLSVSAAAGQMARRYGIPSMVGSWGIGGELGPEDTNLSLLAGSFMRVFSNTDLTCGFGGMDSALGCSMEQMVIDANEWEDFSAFLKSYKFSEEQIALDVVKEVGHGNSFLTHPHTAKRFKSELYLPNKNRLLKSTTMSNTIYSEAKEVVKKLLREHEVPEIDATVVRQGDQIIAEYEKTL
ncbi:MAG TPA: hypothetical protein ENN25_07680, partial [Euryarchaeota archaeon]|nr:hypothetical protein [Euryarchaeota archaeon]